MNKAGSLPALTDVVTASGVDSHTVLWGQTIIYTCYCLAILSVVAWFAIQITKPAQAKSLKPVVFYSWVGFLVAVGVSLHLLTYNTIPWVKQDLHGAGSQSVPTYRLSVANHQFSLPTKQIEVPCDTLVKFAVQSTDLTYGFGLFRQDNSMVMQMQVVPGHKNELLWKFTKDGVYNIRSTEYSGPKGYRMIVKDAVKVSGCGNES